MGATEQTLVVTRDDALAREVEGCAAGAGTAVTVSDDPAAAVRSWGAAALVLVGADAAGEVAATGPPRREHVHLLARDPVGAQELRHAVRLGARSVLELPTSVQDLAMLLAAVGDPRAPGRVLAVVAGSGGAGASTLASAVALSAAASGSVALVATDPDGADPALVLGAGVVPGKGGGLGWDDLARTGGVVAPSALRGALPVHREVAVLGWSAAGGARTAPAPAVVREALEAARQAYDLVVVDLAAHTRAPWDEVVGRSDRVWVVVRPTAVGLATARSRVVRAGRHVRLLVRGAGVADAVVSDVLGEEVALRLSDDRRLDESLDLGRGPLTSRRAALALAARSVVTDADVRWAG